MFAWKRFPTNAKKRAIRAVSSRDRPYLFTFENMNKFLGICAVSLIAFGTANTSAMTVSNINTAYQSGHDDVLPYVSPDKKKVVLVVENSGKKSVIADGVPGKTYDSVSVLFSPDSSEFVYF